MCFVISAAARVVIATGCFRVDRLAPRGHDKLGRRDTSAAAAQASFSRSVKQQQPFQHCAASMHPQRRCIHGKGLLRSFTEAVGTGMPTVAAKKAPSAAKTAKRRKSLASSPKRREPGCMGGYYGLRELGWIRRAARSSWSIVISLHPPVNPLGAEKAVNPPRFAKAGRIGRIGKSSQSILSKLV